MTAEPIYEPDEPEGDDQLGGIEADLADLRAAHRGDPSEWVAAADRDSVVHSALEAMIGAIPEWHSQAACRHHRLELFFRSNVEAARKVCRGCPVSEPCLLEALADRTLDYGVRAGLTARQRRIMRTGQ